MITKGQVQARVREIVAKVDAEIAAERKQPHTQQAKTAFGRRHSRKPRPTLDVDTAETHVLHEGNPNEPTTEGMAGERAFG